MDPHIIILKGNETGKFEVANATHRCYLSKVTNIQSVWQSESPLKELLPFFIMQLCIISICTRLLLLVLRRLHQPHFVPQILAGILISPSILGRFSRPGQQHFILHKIYPFRSLTVLETIANLGLVLYMFLIGLQLDLKMTLRTGKKAATIALVGMFIPLLIGGALFILFRTKMSNATMKIDMSLIFWGAALSVTSFTVLTRLLADIKILHTDIGRTAFSSAFLSDLGSWLLVVVVALFSSGNIETQAWSLLGLIAFTLVAFYVVRPAIKWLSKKLPAGDRISDLRICMVLTFVLVCGFATDAMGMYSLTGAFVLGLVMPEGELANAVADRVEDFVSEILLPLYFTITGLRTNVDDIFIKNVYGIGLVVILVACAAKIVSVVLVAYFQKMTLKEGTALGMLMNTKGVLAVVILNIGFDKKILSPAEFGLMVVALLVMSIIVSPIVSALYKPSKRFMHYKRRTLQDTSSDSELRIIACIHETSHVSGLINILEASNATARSPITVYALHLVELSGRTSSAMLIIHTTRKSGVHNSSRAKAQSDQIIDALESYEQDTQAEINVLPLRAMSPYNTMNEDISSLAVDKRAALIIVPFHKQTTAEGKMEETNTEIRMLNQNLLDTSPCSVAIFVDRGFGAMPRMEFVDGTRHIVMIYVGGPDDREALCYAWRMAGHPGITLHVIRFVHDNTTVMSNLTRDDNEFMNQFKHVMGNDTSVTYTEKRSDTGEETVAILNEMEHNYDLYVVGRGEGVSSPITAGLLDWSDCPELGAIGDILVSSDFAAAGSVLVVQQYKVDPTTIKTTTTTSDDRGNGIREQEQGADGYEEYNPRSWRAGGGEGDDGSESQFLHRWS